MGFVVGGMMLVFGWVGFALIWESLKQLLLVLRRTPHLVQVEGVITGIAHRAKGVEMASGVKVRSRVSSGSSRSNFPIVEFRTATGEVRTFQSIVGDSGYTSRYYVDAKIAVFYDPDGILEPQIESLGNAWTFPLALLGGGIAALAAAGFIWFAFSERLFRM